MERNYIWSTTGSIIGPLLFNIYLNDLFMVSENSNIANYEDDNSPYACKRDTASVILQLENDTNSLLQWVANNGLKANPDKFHLILNETCSNHFIKIENFIIHNNEYKRLLGITIDGKLSLTSMLLVYAVKQVKSSMPSLEFLFS